MKITTMRTKDRSGIEREHTMSIEGCCPTMMYEILNGHICVSINGLYLRGPDYGRYIAICPYCGEAVEYAGKTLSGE